MTESPNIAALAAHLADAARARMVLALMDGRALTVGELGQVAGLGKASASEHAARLLAAGLLRADRQGRHKYISLAGPQVAHLVEAMMVLAGGAAPAAKGAAAQRLRTGPRDPALRQARVCYNHLAGALGVQVYQSLSARGFLAHAPGGLTLSDAGRAFVTGFGLSEADLAPGRAPLCRDCLDWSERQSHLGGRLGRLMLAQMERLDWLRRLPASRVLTVTPRGQAGLARQFPAPLPA